MSLEVIKPGLLTTLQDAGRPGLAHLGIGRAGAFDTPALRIANALCGNPSDACVLEITLLGPTLRAHHDAWIAVTGAPIPVRVGGIEQAMWAPVPVPAGTTIELGAMREGCRSYLAVQGGFDAAPVLGSRSMDVNARIGPFGGRPLQAGDVLPIATADGGTLASAADAGTVKKRAWRLDPRPWFDEGNTRRTLRLIPGAHFERLAESSRERLFSGSFKVDADSNRVGLRLIGPRLEWTTPIEMVSEGCVPGLLQLPPSGHPIAFGPECPVSGGYPRIGQIAAVDMSCLAQLRPGDALRFAACTFDEAVEALRKRERALQKLEATIDQRLRQDRDARGPWMKPRVETSSNPLTPTLSPKR
ncbi:MAG: biotin-dependent carboxyltransferase family protein [Rhodanobacteraceae bacterium]|nr:MAG: biotin-dependent carboxyltransferase family protein [Rhodanobacteraceae bacterium]